MPRGVWGIVQIIGRDVNLVPDLLILTGQEALLRRQIWLCNQREL
jgi:hypothetical protein